MCGKDRCFYYGCDMCGWRLDPGHIDGLPYMLERGECDCLNATYAELCGEACRDRYLAEILECTCGSSVSVVVARRESVR